MQIQQETTSEPILYAIKQRLGFVPAIFTSTQQYSQVLENQWHQALFAYIDNPLPAQFKEQLLAYLSRFCSNAYCMVCHSCMLKSLGMKANEILLLLTTPPPTEEEVEQCLVLLEDSPDCWEYWHGSNITACWPWQNTSIEKSLLKIATFLFLQPKQAERFLNPVRMLLGGTNYEYLVVFLAYVKMYHLWVEAHPEVTYDNDERVREQLGALYSDEPELGNFFQYYNEQVCIERKTAETRLMTELISIAGHELRTPITSIKGNIQLALRRIQNFVLQEHDFAYHFAIIQDLLERAEHQVTFLNRLVSDLLDLSRIQADKMEMNFEPCCLVTLVKEVVTDQRSYDPQRTINLELPEEEDIYILADADRIGQVLTNYVNNALKYSRPEFPVVVRLEVSGRTARVLVIDEGTGIPVFEQERIWERFYRVKGIKIQSGTSAGLGLGLHICRTIIDRHQGKVGVKSELGIGSTFWFSLPLISD